MGAFREDNDAVHPPGISQCSTLQNQIENIRSTDDDLRKISEQEGSTPWHTNHMSTSIGSGLESLQNGLHVKSSNAQGTSFSPLLGRLRDSLRGACVSQSRYNTGIYIPEDKQHEILTEFNVYETLKLAGVASHEENLRTLVNQVLPTGLGLGSAEAIESRSRQKLFAILIMLGVPEIIGTFIRKDIWDTHLPLHRNLAKNRWECCDDINGNKVLKVVHFMDHTRDPHSYLEDLFEKYQWYMIAPVFDLGGPELIHYSLLKNTPLPFIDSLDSEEPARGGFGEVRRVRIHRAHHNLNVRDFILYRSPPEPSG